MRWVLCYKVRSLVKQLHSKIQFHVFYLSIITRITITLYLYSLLRTLQGSFFLAGQIQYDLLSIPAKYASVFSLYLYFTWFSYNHNINVKKVPSIHSFSSRNFKINLQYPPHSPLNCNFSSNIWIVIIEFKWLRVHLAGRYTGCCVLVPWTA